MIRSCFCHNVPFFLLVKVHKLFDILWEIQSTWERRSCTNFAWLYLLLFTVLQIQPVLIQKLSCQKIFAPNFEFLFWAIQNCCLFVLTMQLIFEYCKHSLVFWKGLFSFGSLLIFPWLFDNYDMWHLWEMILTNVLIEDPKLKIS